MSTTLTINLDDLLYCRGVESERVEFKESWNAQNAGPQVLRTICAFANDYHNLNGGYVVIGVGEREGRAELPPAGLSADNLDAAQKWPRGKCGALDPPYFPVLSPETVGDRLILVVLRETLVNAVYHRGYDVDQPEPTKVYLFPGRIEVISYPGPVPGVEPDHLLPNAEVRAAPARNRRIGEFLKELKLAEGRLFGLPKVFQAMAANGSPVPRFEFDAQRTYFQATLPAHPEYGALSALRDAAHLRALGEHAQARHRVAAAWGSNPNSGILAAAMIDTCAASGELDRAEEVLETFKAQGPEHAVAHVENRLIETFVEAGLVDRARRLLTRSRPVVVGQDAIDAAILARRARDSRVAHRYFERAGDVIYADPRALHEFAQTKLWPATEAHRQRRRDLNRRFLTEARTLLERVIQLEAAPIRHAWAWRDLARTLNWLRAPLGEVEAAYRRAIELLPDEPRFVAELQSMQAPRNRTRNNHGG